MAKPNNLPLVFIRTALVVGMLVLAYLEFHAPIRAWVIGAVSGAIWGGSSRWLALIITNRYQRLRNPRRILTLLPYGCIFLALFTLSYLQAGGTDRSPLTVAIPVFGVFLTSFAVIFQNVSRVKMPIAWFVGVVPSAAVFAVWTLFIPLAALDRWAGGLGVGFLLASIGASYQVDALTGSSEL